MVDMASNGDEARARVRESLYDIAFVDMQMPKMNGVELLGYLRCPGEPRRGMLTAYGTVARAVEAMKLGGADFIEKPFDPNAVPLLCNEIFERRKNWHAGSVDELLHLADPARGRKACIEARLYLKIAMQRDLSRPEPYFQLGELAEIEGHAAHAAHYYDMALDAQSDFQPAREALKRLGASRGEPPSVRFLFVERLDVTLSADACAAHFSPGELTQRLRFTTLPVEADRLAPISHCPSIIRKYATRLCFSAEIQPLSAVASEGL